MRVLIISDIHSNLEALHAVLQDAQERGPIDQLWCLGDIVGYGPDPRECIAAVRERATLCLAGNHDLGAVGKVGLDTFNAYAAAACRWTAAQLTQEDRRFLESLPPLLVHGDFTLAHGSPREPVWEYVVSEQAALAGFRSFQTPYCLVGHSHIPFLCLKGQDEKTCTFARLPLGQGVKLGRGPLIVNPGSVGQPRDNDPRASYLVYDAELNAMFHYRVAYPFQETQEKVLQAGLPERLASRLSQGW